MFNNGAGDPYQVHQSLFNAEKHIWEGTVLSLHFQEGLLNLGISR